MKLFKWKFDEPYLHACIISAYTSKGYDCVNFHESGAPVENGVDILAKNGEDEIAFCVKIKPTTKDIEQFGKFSTSSFKNKYYVYIEDPTRPFHDELSKHPEIKILNANLLDELFKKERVLGYLENYIYSHEIFREFEKILQICHSVKESTFQNISLSEMNLLWEWKDRAVSFNKTAQTLFDLKDNKFKSIYDDPDYKYFFEFINELEECLDYLARILERLRVQMEEVKKKYPGVLSYFWAVCKPRSNWFELLYPLDRLGSDQISAQFFRFFFKSLPSEAPYSMLTWVLERIQEIGEGVEDGVNWVFEDLVLQKKTKGKKK